MTAAMLSITAGNKSRERQSNFQPSGGDSIWLLTPSDYGLAKGISDPLHEDNTDERFYLLSKLHQFHCLNIVRLRCRQYESQLRKPVTEPETIMADWTEYTDHCFESLGQNGSGQPHKDAGISRH
ncbi:hypothetical protein N7490_000573 [Penicillium lividum]|nr:hypothetical protein N7490_000573 [Penicillium lividum]